MKEVEEYKIWSAEHRAWWRADAHGYTTIDLEAGIFTKDQAESHLKTAGPEKKLEMIGVGSLSDIMGPDVLSQCTRENKDDGRVLHAEVFRNEKRFGPGRMVFISGRRKGHKLQWIIFSEEAWHNIVCMAGQCMNVAYVKERELDKEKKG